MSQSNYKEEALELFRHIRANKISDNDALSAVDRLNASTIGEDDNDMFARDHHDPDLQIDVESRNQLRSELRQKFGVNHLGADTKKEDK